MNEIRQSHSILIMTPKRHRQLDPLRKPTSYTLSIIQRNKQTMVGNSKNSLFKSIGFVIVLAQCFALMPVNGVLGRDISFIKFKWLCPKMFYSIFGIVGILFTAILYILQFTNNEKEFSDIDNGFLYVQYRVIEMLEIEERRHASRILRRMIRDAQDPFYISSAEFVANFLQFYTMLQILISYMLSVTSYVNIVFYISAAITAWLFILLSRNWAHLNEKWHGVEYAMRSYSFQPNVNLRFKLTTGIIMSLALVEHILSIVRNESISRKCPIAETDPAKAYFGHVLSHLFSIVPFNGWYAFMMEIFNIMATFIWNFNDLFIILMCAALALRFQQINKRIRHSENKNETFWKEIRQDYTQLSILCKTLDSAIHHIVTVAFGNNLFFICVQLFHTLKPFRGSVDTAYFFCSFGFLLGRTAVLSAYCCWINDESKNTLTYLFVIPSEDFGVEASRLIQQISFYPVAISGSNYFAVTRGLCLQVAGAVITFELILFQIGPMFVKTDENEKIFCVY